jgi:hypothetical protein
MPGFIEYSSRISPRFLDPSVDYWPRIYVKFVLIEECMDAFNILKKLLTSVPIMMAPNWSLPFELMCDTSDFELGIDLGQRINKVPQSIYYASKTLNDAQLTYFTTEKELLAITFA